MTGRRVLVTRPQPGAAKTAQRLEEMGFSPVILPLSQTQGLRVSPPDIPDMVDAVAVTSVNAIRHAPAEIVARLAGLRCFAVGKKTAAAASKAGFSNVIEGPGDASGLAAMIVEHERPGARIAYLTGHVRLPTFEASLADAGIRVLPIETYDTLAVDHSDAELARLFGSGPIDAVLLYSSKAAEATAMVCRRRQWAFHFAEARHFCLSSRIAAALSATCQERVLVAEEPSEESLLALLARAF
jgi:uroporphyrinogen-III synthase